MKIINVFQKKLLGNNICLTAVLLKLYKLSAKLLSSYI